MKQIEQLHPKSVPHAKPRRWRAFRESPRARKGVAGSSIVEFAFVVPVLLTLVMAMFVFGIALNQYLMLTNGATMAAQAMAMSRGNTADPCNTAVQAFYQAAPNLKQSSLKFTIALNGGTVNTGGTTTCPIGSNGTTNALVEGQNAQVTVTYPCNLTVMAVNFAPSCTLTAQTAEAIE